LARILANLVLAQASLPPAIVKNESERGNYIECLAHSDEAGDILPLAGLFVKTLRRYAKQVERPSYLKKLFAAEIKLRSQGEFEAWRDAFTRFAVELSGELRLSRLTATIVGTIGLEEFRYLRRDDSAGNTWWRLVRNASGSEILMWVGYPSSDIRRWLAYESEAYPSIYFSVRNATFRVMPYRRATLDEIHVSEVMVVPGTRPDVLALVDGKLLRGNISDAAATVAGHIVTSFASGRIPEKPDTDSGQP